MTLKLSNNEQVEDSLFLLLIGIGMITYYAGLANMYICLIVLSLRMITFNRVELGLFSLFIGSGLFGRMFASQSLNLFIIVFFLLLGLVLLHKEIAYAFNSNLHAYLFWGIYLVFFLIEFLLGPYTDYSKEKILKLAIRGSIWLSSFIILLNVSNISPNKIAIGFILLAIFYLFQAYQFYHVVPKSLYDFSFFRDIAVEVGRNTNRTMMVNSHTLGYLSLAALVFWFGRNRDELDKDSIISSCLFTVIAVWIIALSGARQVLLSLLFVFIVIYLLGKKKMFTINNVFNIIGIICLFYIFITVLHSSHYDRLLETSQSASYRLHRDIDTPLKILDINPITGVGFGGYPLYANKDYPHNIFIEILCELGIVGMIILFLITALYILSIDRSNGFIRLSSKANFYLFPLFIVLLSRSMISGDLADNIGVFCLILICGTVSTESVVNKSLPNE